MVDLRRNITKVILLNIIAIIIILASFEFFSRLILSPNAPFNERLSFNLEYKASGFVQFFPLPNQTIYEVDKGIIKYNNIKYRINRYGYRGDDFPLEKDRNEIRVVVMGGSHVFDLNSFDYEGNYGFPYIIQKYFQDNNLNVRVINTGIPGDDTRNLFIKIILDVHRYKPDIVIINSIWNDTKWISRTNDSTLLLATQPKAFRKNPMVEPINLVDKIFGFSVLYRKSRDHYWIKKLNLGQNKLLNEGIIEKGDALTKNFDTGLEQYKINLIGAIQAIQSIKAQPILAIEERFISAKNTDIDKRRIQYHMVNVSSHTELVNLFHNCDTIIGDVSREYNVPLINVNTQMEGDARYFVDHVHTNPKGSEFIAKNYYGILKKLIEKEVGK